MGNLSMKDGPREWEPSLEDITFEERRRLLAYCTRVAADAHIAEDLVQQTLLEAWQHVSRLYASEVRMPWLLGIARNICLRWLRSHGKELSRQISLDIISQDSEVSSERELADEADPLEEIERADLADLLEQALSLLPPSTRAALVGRYVEDVPQAALADRLGLTEGAVEARLHRGKAALRKLLTTTFSEHLAAYRLDVPASERWEETRIWCPTCGQHRLVAQIPEPPGSIAFRCPGCNPDPTLPRCAYKMTNSYFLQTIGGLSQPRTVLNRGARWTSLYFVQAIQAGWAPCTNCGYLSQLFLEEDAGDHIRSGPIQQMLVVCPKCEEIVSTSFGGLVVSLPPVQQFWRTHGRIRTLPMHEVEADGKTALVARFQSVTTADRLTLVVARDAFHILRVESNGAGKSGESGE